MPTTKQEDTEAPIAYSHSIKFKILNHLRKIIGAVSLLILSVVFIWGGVALGLGSPFRLGTGAFPFMTGLILAILSLIMIIQDFYGDDLKETPDWISFIAISASLITFALCAGRYGLIPAAFLTTVIASLPDKSLPFKGKVLLGAIVAFGSWLLFIKILDLPFKAIIGI